ncbi:dipeptide ABC transporter ATP-binding protein [Streptomyces sp. SID8379]|uniref:ABC transporter ATP-binding protein n=1 Tax=unclassified Streptomyces TaxID=2593676 RepID=UPI00037ECC23|nr:MULTISPECIES: ABC transporter ATP-binding protein [unclassified Streptomyces]MYW63574.1 dipeptide ABC transporter ATP-binding protein [Streptomyces sp. SID8379]
MNPAITITDLRVVLGRTGPDVVDDIAFDVAAGEILALVGESGSGKTTIATALLAHTRRGARVDAGEVVLDGRELLGAPPAEARRRRGSEVAYVPQDPAASLNPVMRVGSQIREVLDVHHAGTPAERDARVREVLAEVALPDDDAFLRRYPHQLSGGQLQRVGIAMAFALRPKVLVLDEPTTGLDVTTQAHVLATVRELCARHDVAAVYVTHDLSVVGEFAHRVAVMYAGRIVEIGPRETVFATPSHPYTRALLAAVPSVNEARVLTGIPGSTPSPGRRPTGCRFRDRCDFAEAACAEGEPELVPVTDSEVRARCRRIDHVRTRPLTYTVAAPAGTERPEPVLTVRDLTAGYGSRQILHGIDLDVGRNECVAVVGQSGSGKSTLSRAIGGLHDEWTGAVTFQGEPVPAGARHRSRELRKAVQYVFQNPYLALNPRMTVGKIIRRPLELFGLAKGAAATERVHELLAQVMLSPGVHDLRPDRLSGGERQRVAIARALACEPELLICDEVTSALDVSVQASIVTLLDDLRTSRGLSMLFVTHNLALVRSLATRVAVLSDGRIVEEGPTAAVLDHPSDPYTRQLLSDTPGRSDGAPELVGEDA